MATRPDDLTLAELGLGQHPAELCAHDWREVGASHVVGIYPPHDTVTVVHAECSRCADKRTFVERD